MIHCFLISIRIRSSILFPFVLHIVFHFISFRCLSFFSSAYQILEFQYNEPVLLFIFLCLVFPTHPSICDATNLPFRSLFLPPHILPFHIRPFFFCFSIVCKPNLRSSAPADNPVPIIVIVCVSATTDDGRIPRCDGRRMMHRRVFD